MNEWSINQSNQSNQSTPGSGIVGMILGVMRDHMTKGDLVKSACHTLAILSDTKGQVNKQDEGTISAAAGMEQ